MLYADDGIKKLLTTLVEVNEDFVHCVPLHPLYANTGLSVDQLYAEVVVREDRASIQREEFSKPEDHHRVISDLRELFTKDDKPVRNVYMLGQPGYGKTTFCLYLLHLWCAAKTSARAGLSPWQLDILMFHFVFYVSLRHVHRRRSSIVEMICEDVFERYDGKEVIRYVLGNSDYRCLVIVDGLDEWIISTEVQAKLRDKGMPNTNGLSENCTVLFMSRHWKMELIQPKYSRNDSVVEILGLTDKGVHTIIHNVLVNFFKLDADTLVYKKKSGDIKAHIERSESSHKIPMLVTISVFLGYDGKEVQESDTGLVMDQLKLLIMRAFESGCIEGNVADGLDKATSSTLDIPKIIQMNKLLSQFIVVFYKLGRIAFKDLMSTESHLVFEKETLQEELGDHVLDTALKVGIVSQMRAPGRFRKPKVSIQFLHKSIQEAMAALYVVCNKSDAFTSLCEYCCAIEDVMEMSNVIQHISGFSPEKGCDLSEHVAKLAEKDQDIVNDREKLGSFMDYGPAGQLYHMQFKSYKDMTHTLSITRDSNPTTRYQVSDVFLQNWHYDDDGDVAKMTCDIMRGSLDNILSFTTSVRRTTLSLRPVLQILPKCSKLTTLRVTGEIIESYHELVNVIPDMKHLQNVGYTHYERHDTTIKRNVDSSIVRAFLQLPLLKHIHLQSVTLDDKALMVANDVELLKKIDLKLVRMSPEAWENFSKSLLSLRHLVEVTVSYFANSKYESPWNSPRNLLVIAEHSRVVRAILQIPGLKHLTLDKLKLDNDVLMVAGKTHLQKIKLIHMGMSMIAWGKFLNSLLCIKHVVEVEIHNDIIDVFRMLLDADLSKPPPFYLFISPPDPLLSSQSGECPKFSSFSLPSISFPPPSDPACHLVKPEYKKFIVTEMSDPVPFLFSIHFFSVPEAEV